MFTSNHWLPPAEVYGRICRLALQDPGRAPPHVFPPPAPPVPAVTPPITVEGFDEAEVTTPPPLPHPVRVPTVIIWSSEICGACRSSAPTFRALENNTSGWTVVRLEATVDVLRRYPGHLLSLPTYDFLTPQPGMHAHTNALGIPDVRLRTVRINSVDVLRTIIPDLRLE